MNGSSREHAVEGVSNVIFVATLVLILKLHLGFVRELLICVAAYVLISIIEAFFNHQ